MNELQIIRYNNIPVITTKQIAEIYGTDKKTISYDFNHNKDRYVEGKHYILLMNEDKRKFLNRHEIHDGSKRAKQLYLWTERGALMLAKSINTDVAWEAYERLVDFYFQKKEEQVKAIGNADKVEIQLNQSRCKAPLVSWYGKNIDRLGEICKRKNISMKELMHIVLKELSKKYNIRACSTIYKRENGYSPAYSTDIISYFPEIEEDAEKILKNMLKNV
jgi:phage regulator Rha-like protein